MAHADERLCTEGKLALSIIQDKQPAYHKAVVEGIAWDILLWPAEDRWPWLSRLLQESGNATQQISRCESRVEVMFKINDIAARNLQYHNDPKWGDVAQEALRSGSPYKDEIDGLVNFVRNLGGGLDDPIFIYELRDFSRQLPSLRTPLYVYAKYVSYRFGIRTTK